MEPFIISCRLWLQTGTFLLGFCSNGLSDKAVLVYAELLGTSLIKLLNIKIATMQQILAENVNLDLNISSV